MADSPDDFEIVDRSDLAEESDLEGFSESESSWPDEFEVGTVAGFDPGQRPSSLISRIREFFAQRRVLGRIAESGIEIVDPDDDLDGSARVPEHVHEDVSGHRSKSADHPRVIETKAIYTKIADDGEFRQRNDRVAPDPILSSTGIPNDSEIGNVNTKAKYGARPDRFEEIFDEDEFDIGEVGIAEKTRDGRNLTWREILLLPFAPLIWIVSKVRSRKNTDEITDDFAVASKRNAIGGSQRDIDSPAESSASTPITTPLSVPDEDELHIGTRSIVRKISEIRSAEQPQAPPARSDHPDDYSVISSAQLGKSIHRPGASSTPGSAQSPSYNEGTQESLIPGTSIEDDHDRAISLESTISGRLQRIFDPSDYASTRDVHDEHVEVGVPLDPNPNPSAIRTDSLGKLTLSIVKWLVTIPKRCLISESDLYEQRRLNIEPLLASIPAVALLISLAVQISRVSEIDKFMSYMTYSKASLLFDNSGNADAAMLCAIRSCLENATPENRYQVARLFTKSSDLTDVAHGFRLIRLLASPSGGNQADAHLFIANELLRQYRRDPDANRNLYFRYLSELRTGFGSSPNRYDILEPLAEGLVSIGESRSLTGFVVPHLEYWPQGHFFLSQAAFARGDDELRKSHALAMVRHFRSTPTELEMDRKYRIRYALSLALAGEFSDAESFVREMAESSQDAEIHKSLAEQIDLIRIVTRIHEFPANSDQDIEVLGSFLEGDGLSQDFEAAIKRQLLRKGPFRPALLKLCRKLYATRKASFDADDYVFWASILRQNQQNAEAREFLENAIKITPEHDIASNNLANLLYKLEPVDLNRALSLSESVLKRNPKEPTFLETRGQILARLGKNQEAIEDLTKSLEAFPNVPEIHEALSRCYRSIGNADLAEAHQKRYSELKFRPESPGSKSPGTNES